MSETYTRRAARITSEVGFNTGEHAALLALGKKLRIEKLATLIHEIVRDRLKADGLLG